MMLKQRTYLSKYEEKYLWYMQVCSIVLWEREIDFLSIPYLKFALEVLKRAQKNDALSGCFKNECQQLNIILS